MSVINPLTGRKIKIGGPAFNALPKKLQIQLAVEADSLVVKPHLNSTSSKNRHGEPVCETVLKIERNMVGQSAFTYDLEKHTAHLVNISVSPDSRKKGYGSLIWDKTIQECRTLGIKKLTFTAVPPGDSSSLAWQKDLKALVKWYESKGAKVVKTEDKTPFMEYIIPYFGGSPKAQKALKTHKVDRPIGSVVPDRTKHIKDLKALAKKCFPKDVLERIDVRDLDILQALSDTSPQKLRGVALVDVKAKRIELVCVYPENAAVRRQVIETAVMRIGGDLPIHNLEFDSNYQASLKVYSELGFMPLEIKMMKKPRGTVREAKASSPKKHSPKEWKIKTPKGILRIETVCEETWPCHHDNSMNLRSPEIWAMIKKQPSLQKSQPELWKHFSVYETAILP